MTRDELAKAGNHRICCDSCGRWMVWRVTCRTPVARALPPNARICVDCLARGWQPLDTSGRAHPWGILEQGARRGRITMQEEGGEVRP